VKQGSHRAASLAAAIALFGDSALYPILSAQGSTLGHGPIAIGVLLAANRFVRLALNRPVGRLVDRVGPRAPLVAAAAIAALTTASYGAFSTRFAPFLASRLVWGLAWSILRLAAYVAILEGDPGSRGARMGGFTSIARLGSLGGVLGGGWLADTIGFERTFFVLGVATLPAIVCGAVAFPPGPRPRAAPVERRGGGLVAGEGPLLIAGIAVAFAGHGLLVTSAGIRVKELAQLALARGAAPEHVSAYASAAVAGRWIALIGFSTAAGWLSDRIGRRAIAAVAGLATAASLVIAARAAEVESFVVAAIVAFVFFAAAQAAIDGLVQDLAAASPDPTGVLQRYSDAIDLGSAAGAIALALLSPPVALGLGTLYVGSATAVALATAFAGARAGRPS
jgi:MFS family permease